MWWWFAGCVINSDKWPRPRDLTPAWKVDKTRILAVAAEPPEAVPGAVVTFRALVGHPPGDDGDDAVLWIACPIEESLGGTCGGDLEGVDLENLDPEELVALGLVGFEPYLPPVYVVPDDLLDGVPAEDRAEGTYVLVQTTVLPPEVLEDPASFSLDPAALEASFKRLVVSEAATPNHNPVIEAFRVDGVPVGPDAVVYLDPEQGYELEAVLASASVESYVFVDSAGEADQRVEEPYVAWFSTGGDVVEEVTLYPYTQATFVAPRRGEGTWYAVARDRRGGLAWWTQRWAVGP